MSSYHDAVKRFLSDINKFINVTLQSEILSIPAKKERNKLTEALQKLFSDYSSLAPSSGDEGSTSSAKDQGSQDESRNTLDSSHGSEDDSYADNIPDTTVKALTNPLKIGYLERRQKDLLFTSWQKRYCVLHKNILYVFKKPGDKKQQGAFFVTGYELREAPQNVKDSAKKECSFELVCPGKKTHQFLTENKEDLQSWRSVIETASKLSPTGANEEEIDGEDLYEPLDEVAPGVTGGSITSAAPEESEELYDEATSLVQKTPNSKTTPASSKTVNVSPFKKSTPTPAPIKVDQNQNEKPMDEFEDDNLIYEPIDVDLPQGNQSDDLPSPAAAPPPLPPHVAKHADTSSNLPPPPPPKQNDASLPPLPSRTLPPPPSEPLPAIPPTPKKKTTPVLGKILPPSEDFENMFYGMWSCTGTSDDELSFKRGQIVHVISRDLDKDNWWVGELDGKIGLVPKSYLTPAYELVP